MVSAMYCNIVKHCSNKAADTNGIDITIVINFLGAFFKPSCRHLRNTALNKKKIKKRKLKSKILKFQTKLVT